MQSAVAFPSIKVVARAPAVDGRRRFAFVKSQHKRTNEAASIKYCVTDFDDSRTADDTTLARYAPRYQPS
jgi:hypothetical protein